MIKQIPFEAIYRIMVLAGLVATMYLQTHYVPRQEFRDAQDAMSRKLQEIGASLSLINTQMAVRESDKDQVRDHEARIRILEQNRH